MAGHIIKSHNKSLLLYHIVCPAKYRAGIFNLEVEETLKVTCEFISTVYEIFFVEIGTDYDHVHFLVQSVPMLSPTKVVTTIKSLTAKAILQNHPESKKKLQGGKVWTSGYYINTVSKYGSEKQIQNYIKNQGKNHKTDYKKISTNVAVDLFEGLGV
jgi:putative transposase